MGAAKVWGAEQQEPGRNGHSKAVSVRLGTALELLILGSRLGRKSGKDESEWVQGRSWEQGRGEKGCCRSLISALHSLRTDLNSQTQPQA